MVRRRAWLVVARVEAWSAQGGRCFYCLARISRRQATADHVRARANGGTDRDNIVAACAACNVAKGSLPEAKFRELMRRSATRGGSMPMGIYLAGLRRRLEKRTDEAVARIMRMVGR